VSDYKCSRCLETYKLDGMYHFSKVYCPTCQRARASILHPVTDAIHDAIGKLNKQYVSAELIGECVSVTYDDLKEVLERGIGLVLETRNHTHQWNDDDYCDICGADGRA